MTESEKIEYLGGQVHALMGVAMAAIYSHPDLPTMARAIAEVSQANLARAESVLVDDNYIAGIQDIWERMQRALETAPKWQTNPKAPR